MLVLKKLVPLFMLIALSAAPTSAQQASVNGWDENHYSGPSPEEQLCLDAESGRNIRAKLSHWQPDYVNYTCPWRMSRSNFCHRVRDESVPQLEFVFDVEFDRAGAHVRRNHVVRRGISGPDSDLAFAHEFPCMEVFLYLTEIRSVKKTWNIFGLGPGPETTTVFRRASVPFERNGDNYGPWTLVR